MVLRRFAVQMSVCKVPDLSQVDLEDTFCFLGKTDEELSVVCRTERAPANATQRDDGWRMLRIEGQLDFSLIGILAEIAEILAQNEIGIFAVSTYNTDYILTKQQHYQKALCCLREAGHQIEG